MIQFKAKWNVAKKVFSIIQKNPSDERFLLYFYASVVIGNVSCVKQGDNDSQYTFPFFFGICIRICHTIHTITKIL